MFPEVPDARRAELAERTKLLTAVEGGEEIQIARAGKPVARLVPEEKTRQPRQPGFLKGKIWVSDDFDEPDEELERLFGLRD